MDEEIAADHDLERPRGFDRRLVDCGVGRSGDGEKSRDDEQVADASK